MSAPATETKQETTQETRQKLDALQAELSVRRSTRHFARSGISLMAAMILSGATGKLFHDSKEVLGYSIASVGTLLVLGLVVFSVREYLVGRRTVRSERSRFEELKALRRQLQLDDPPSLLPSR